MSFLSKLFGNSNKSEGKKLQDIPLNDLGIKGEDELKALVGAKDYSGMKFKSLELYNLAYDKYLDSPRQDEDLELMYASLKNLMACELMWYYHDQIIGLGFGDIPEEYVVVIDKTIPFELPDSKFYHEEEIPSKGLRV